MNKLFPIVLALMMVGLMFSQMTGNNTYENRNPYFIYVGFGKGDNSNIEESTETPLSVGIMGYAKGIKAYIGIDWAKEGTMLSSTYGRDDAIEQGKSFNLTLSKSLPIKIKDTSGTIGFLIGYRDVREYCPTSLDSYLGYECYADEDPKYSDETNFGAILTIRNKNTTIGYRYTKVSNQIIIGYSFGW